MRWLVKSAPSERPQTATAFKARQAIAKTSVGDAKGKGSSLGQQLSFVTPNGIRGGVTRLRYNER